LSGQSTFSLTNSRGWPIRGDIHSPGGAPRGVVVVAHGFKGFKDWGHFPYVCERLATAGWLAVRFNFSGSGIGEIPSEFTETDRFRDNTLSLEIEDLKHVIEFALERPEAAGHASAALVGHSRGAISVLRNTLDRRDVSRAVTWAGVGILDDRFPRDVRAEWRARGFLPVVNSRTGQVFQISVGGLDDLEAHLEDYDPVRIADRIDVPLLLVHGTGDRSVPVGESRAVAAAAPRARLVEIDGADHTFGAVQPFRGTTPHLERALDETIAFLNEGNGA